MECGTEDEATGFLSAACLDAMDSLIRQATERGLWVIIAARAKYAAGWDWPAQPDVFHDASLRRKYYAMWTFVAARYSTWARIAGYEIMSEPRTKVVPQAEVMEFMQGGCDAVHAQDPRALCVVGPAPYYKAWELSDALLLPRRNVLYTFDFFVPWKFVAGDSSRDSAAFPATYPCNQVYDTWWGSFCASAEQSVLVDAEWLRATMRAVPHKLRSRGVPVYCNQWGVKGEVLASRGRLAYAAALLGAFTELNISNSYWIWRSMEKGGRDLDAPVWGFELLHNNGAREELDREMIAVLQAGSPLAQSTTTALTQPPASPAPHVPPAPPPAALPPSPPQPAIVPPRAAVTAALARASEVSTPPSLAPTPGLAPPAAPPPPPQAKGKGHAGGAQPPGSTATDGSPQLALALAAAPAAGGAGAPRGRVQLRPPATSLASLAVAGVGLACCAACTAAGGLALARRCRAPPAPRSTATTAARRRRRAPRELAAASTPAQELAAKAARAARVVGAARTPQGHMTQGRQARPQGRYVRVAVACERQPSAASETTGL